MTQEHQIIDQIRFQTAKLAELDLEAQHQLDLKTLDRIETQRECFFDVMGEVHAAKILEANQ